MYILQVKFCTDGDFGCKYKHPLFTYDGDEDYSMEIFWANKEEAIEESIKILKEIKMATHSSRDYILEDVKMMLDLVIMDLEAGKDSIYKSLSGNQDGTEVIFGNAANHLFLKIKEAEIILALRNFQLVCNAIPEEDCHKNCPYEKICLMLHCIGEHTNFRVPPCDWNFNKL